MDDFSKEDLDQIGRIWDKPFRRRSGRSMLKKCAGFLGQILRQRRLPNEGWVRSAWRARRPRTGWWSNPLIQAEIGRRISGRPAANRTEGFVNLIRQRFGSALPFERGISIGCGDGSKELMLIRAGIVNRVDLFELSEASVKRGQALYGASGFGDRVVFRREIDFDDSASDGSYDVVFWHDSLHHMPNVQKAIEWSRRVLRNGGGFCMDEYVGPTRFQWTDRQMELATKILRSIPCCFRVLPGEPFGEIRSAARRPTIAEMIDMDPSEAVDSGSIRHSLNDFFPDATIREFGGIGFFLALHDFLPNLDGARDSGILRLAMLADELCIDMGESLYAAAVAAK